MELIIYLLAAHWLCDYPLQGEFLSRAKQHGPLRRYHLIAHSGIHGGAVALILSNPFLGLAEWFVHAVTDELKIRDKISFQTDQLIHIMCKITWWIIYLWLASFNA